jgi:hypothetical protein
MGKNRIKMTTSDEVGYGGNFISFIGVKSLAVPNPPYTRNAYIIITFYF